MNNDEGNMSTKESILKAKDEELEKILNAHRTVIKVVGTGGAGNNTITRITEVGMNGVETIAINTDAQDLLFTRADNKIPSPYLFDYTNLKLVDSLIHLQF